MSYKLIMSIVISGPFPMRVNRTLKPQCNLRFQNCGYTWKASHRCNSEPISSVKGSIPPITRSQRSINFSNDTTLPKSLTREPVSRFLISLNKLKQENWSLKKFEPSYRPLYPTSKCISQRPTLKVKRKLPYTSITLQRRNVNSNFDQYYKRELGKRKEPSKMAWPPLYKYKKNSNVNMDSRKMDSEELPSWLLPLYTYKFENNSLLSRPSEDKFSGEAFRWKLDMIESMDTIRRKQANYTRNVRVLDSIPTKGVLPKTRLSEVELLKQRIYEMKENQDTFRRVEEHCSKECAEHSCIGISKETASCHGSKASHLVPKQSQAIENESNMGETVTKNVQSNEKTEIATRNNHQQQEANFGAGDHVSQELTNNQSWKNTKQGKDEDWNVDYLKTRIREMRSQNELVPKVAVEGTVRIENFPKIGKINYRWLRKNTAGEMAVGKVCMDARKIGRLNVGRRRGAISTHSRRYFATLRLLPSTTSRQKRGSHFSNIIYSKTGWINWLKRRFIMEKVKHRPTACWKQTPRNIPHKQKEKHTHSSPSPILWVSKEMTQSCAQNEVILKKEKVNPAVLNAEHRILAGVSRLQAIGHHQAQIPSSYEEVEKKLEKAETNVKILLQTKPTSSVEALLELTNALKKPMIKCSLDRTPVTGYDWILKNRDVVESLKQKGRGLAGETLVPSRVKQSIDDFKVPLRAQIAQYRRSVERKRPGGFQVFGISRRCYSTIFYNEKPSILNQPYILGFDARGLHVDSTFSRNKVGNAAEKYRSGRPPATKYNYQYNRIAKSAHRRKRELKVSKHATKLAKLPKNRQSTPRKTPLAFSNEVAAAQINAIRAGSLKKQVDELKQLINKTKDPGRERTQTVPIHGSNEYRSRLRRIVKAAHDSVRKMQITCPKSSSESNLLQKTDSGNKTKPSISQTLSRVNASKAGIKRLSVKQFSKCQENVVHKDSPDISFRLPESESLGRIYSKFKSLVATVTDITTTQAVKNEICTQKTADSSKSLSTIVLSWLNRTDSMQRIEKSGVLTLGNQNPVQLHCNKDIKPSMSVQLWKGDDDRLILPKQVQQSTSPYYRDHLSFLAKAKNLLTPLPQFKWTYNVLPETYFNATNQLQKSVECDKTNTVVSHHKVAESLLTATKADFTKVELEIDSELNKFKAELKCQPSTNGLNQPLSKAYKNVNRVPISTTDSLPSNKTLKIKETTKEASQFDFDGIWGVGKSIMIDDGVEEDDPRTNSSEIISKKFPSCGDPASRINKTQENFGVERSAKGRCFLREQSWATTGKNVELVGNTCASNRLDHVQCPIHEPDGPLCMEQPNQEQPSSIQNRNECCPKSLIDETIQKATCLERLNNSTYSPNPSSFGELLQTKSYEPQKKSACDNKSVASNLTRDITSMEGVAKLLTKDPNINPNTVMKLKLPISNDESPEKTWFSKKVNSN